MTEHGPFTLTELPQGWSVSWPGYESSVVNSPVKVQRLLEILFGDLKLNQAQLGVLLNNGDFETYSIDSILWYSDSDNAKNFLINHIFSTYTVGAVKFNEEPKARQFLDILEQRYIWLKLGGAWS